MNFSRFYDNPENSDVILLLKEGKLYAHQIILKTCSPVLEKMLNSGMKETQTCEISLASFCPKNVQTVVAYMYDIYDKKQIPLNNLSGFEDLLNLVEYLDFVDFKEVISDILSNSYSSKKGFKTSEQSESNNTRVIIDLILKYKLSGVYHSVANYCRYNKDIIDHLALDDYIILRKEWIDESNLIEYDLRWCDHNEPKQIKQFICDIDWRRVGKELLQELLNSPTLTKYPYIYTLVKSHLPVDPFQLQAAFKESLRAPRFAE